MNSTAINHEPNQTYTSEGAHVKILTADQIFKMNFLNSDTLMHGTNTYFIDPGDYIPMQQEGVKSLI